MDPVLHVLQQIGLAGIVVDAQGQVVGSNEKALDLVWGNDGMRGLPHKRGASRKLALQHLANRWALLHPQGRCSLLSSVGVGRNLLVRSIAVDQGSGTTLLILMDVGERFALSEDVLQGAFGLSHAEARLGARMACGDSLSEVAKANSISITTVRTQLASIFAKTHTNRQVEAASLFAQLWPLAL